MISLLSGVFGFRMFAAKSFFQPEIWRENGARPAGQLRGLAPIGSSLLQ